MTGDIEAAGDIITGGLIAHSIEPGPDKAAEHQADKCLNCGTELIGPYCYNCGQNGHIHRSVGTFFHDIAHSVLHFDGKMWRTLPLLVWLPGILTKRYVHGERAKFVSPMALFLFSVFLMFAVFGLLGKHLETDKTFFDDFTQGASKELNTKRTEVIAELVQIDKKIVAAKAAGKNTQLLQQEQINAGRQLRTLNAAPAVATQKDTAFSTGLVLVDQGIAKARENPNLLLYKLQTNAYKFSWLLIPLSVPFVWILFAWHRKRHIYDHIVFVTYSLSFMTLLTVTLTITSYFGATVDTILPIFCIIAPIHIYRQLKQAYDQTRLKAFVRTFLMLCFVWVIIILFLIALVALGVTS